MLKLIPALQYQIHAQLEQCRELLSRTQYSRNVLCFIIYLNSVCHGTVAQAPGSITLYENDLYLLDLETAIWTELDDTITSGVRPVGRIAVGLVAMAGKLYLFGGYGLQGKILQTLIGSTAK
jgi:hypothetical protein